MKCSKCKFLEEKKLLDFHLDWYCTKHRAYKKLSNQCPKGEMKDFRSYYKLPLMIDEYCGNVIVQSDDSGYMRAFDWIENEFIDEYPIDNRKGAQLADHIVRFLNGKTEYKPDFLWSQDPAGDPTVICMNGLPCIELRGWGNLCSQNELTHQEVAKIQDEFRDWIINKLNGIDETD